MKDLVREDVIHSSPTWVVKVGTNVLTGSDGRLDPARIGELAEGVCRLMEGGRRVAVVSSGAVGAGMGRLGLTKRPDDLSMLQAAAAVGQSNLIRAYDDYLRPLGYHAAQLLLTHEDFDSRARYLNMRNTLRALFECRAIPIINENDTISTDEIRFGDNDKLAALVANLIQAELLVILSVAPGLCREDPGEAGGRGAAEVIPVVMDLDETVLGYAGTSRSALGTGGMRSKLEAARLVTQAGGSVIVAPGREPGVLDRIVGGERIGTLFLARGRTAAARERWIGLTARPRGHLVVDAGARRAIETGGGSLLPIGVVDVQGFFEKGDVVGIRDAEGTEFARGLTNYSHREVAKIRGLRTEQIRQELGETRYEEVIHRDNLVVTA